MQDLAQIDICLCTFKRPQLLKETLKSLERQQLPTNIQIKLFVIDNDIAASGQETVIEFQKRGNLDIAYEIEPEQNIALARNRSVRLGNGSWVAFIDDDEIAAENWLINLYECLIKHGADAVFGPVRPIYPDNAPKWVLEGGLVDRPLSETGTVMFTGASGNTIVKRELLNSQLGPFDSSFGLTGGEDSAFFRRAVAQGAKLIWCNEAVVEEKVEPHRMTVDFVKRRAYRSGQCFARITLENATLRAKLFWLLKRLPLTATTTLMFLFSLPFGTKYRLYALRKLFLNLGQLSVIKGNYFEEYRH